ncbi:hypothetical protein Ae201684P_000662 [Aphanomyces euteiches]|uniref:Uncharacterized protein n=1 Tax=Aphanomyces euteiches TaxID=100861 RepID=A0A6G0XQX7_9STRA|nr:hypothetical protein Ae201684_002420 [Aphanomyces euteiches]KAH9087251.1 hypothetical protein Ae201684P_000662 [Aphanomyces euteiches]
MTASKHIDKAESPSQSKLSSKLYRSRQFFGSESISFWCTWCMDAALGRGNSSQKPSYPKGLPDHEVFHFGKQVDNSTPTKNEHPLMQSLSLGNFYWPKSAETAQVAPKRSYIPFDLCLAFLHSTLGS